MESVIFDTPLRSAIEASVNDIDVALRQRLKAFHHDDRDGLAGMALFFGHLALATDSAAHKGAVRTCSDHLVGKVAEVPMRPQLFGGAAGVGWVLAHLERRHLIEAVDFDDLDELLLAALSEETTPHFDLIAGVVGLGVYFLERLPAKSAKEGLEQTVLHLEMRAETTARGVTWFTPPHLVPINQRSAYPDGKFDLGVAHGVPGVVAFLSLALMAGVSRSPSEYLLRESVRWLLSHERLDPSQGAFGNAVDARTPHTSNDRRAAWCYGDLGIAAALLLASKALNDDLLHERARRIALLSGELAERESARVLDTSLCHGSAGLAHLFSLFGDAFGDQSMHQYGLRWYRETLRMRIPTEGIAGFYFYKRAEMGLAGVRDPDPSFLQGAAGVGLCLLDARTRSGDRSWNRLLLLG
jgi:lantibiotic modifying enzyme